MRATRSVIIVLVGVICIVASLLLFLNKKERAAATTTGYSYGKSIPASIAIREAPELIYVSYFESDVVLEIDSSTMQLERQFQVDKPGFLIASSVEPFVYVETTDSPGYMSRINTESGSVDRIEVPPTPTQFCFDEDEDRIWVLGRTWPNPNEYYSAGEAGSHPDTGRLSEIDLASFQVTRTESISPLPLSLIFSQYSGKLYVWHEFESYDPETTQVVGDVVRETDPVTFQEDRMFLAGPDTGFAGLPRMEFWSLDQRYLAIPNPALNDPPNCITIFDLESWQDVTDQFFPQVTSVPFGVRHIRRVPGSNVLWCTGFGRLAPGNTDVPLLMVNSETGDFDTYGVAGPNRWGDLAISPSTCKPYILSPRTDEIFEFDPPNHDPECGLTIITPMPYHGPAPALIEFDATGSYDPDPCDELAYEWDFDGDGVYGEAVDDSYTGDPDNPTHSYTVSYHGPVMLRLSDNHGSEITCAVFVDVDII